MSSKKINETSSAAGGSAWGAFPRKVKKEVKVKIAAVYPPGKNKKSKTPYKMAVIEKKSERALREAVRNLIFLNKVKYHEEQVRREIQEQKIRRVVRYLLNEANSSTPLQKTTGENNALNFLNNVKSTTFDQLYAQLASEKQQREAFKETYKEKIKLYLDALDQQHLILNPEEKANYEKQRSGNLAPPAAQAPVQPETPTEPETSPDLGVPEEETANLTEAAPSGGTTLSNLQTVSDTSHIQSQVIVAQLSNSKLHPTGVKQAEKALEKDLPQIDALYNILTFRPLQLPGKDGAAGEITSDRDAFRKMLIGAMPNSGASGAQLDTDNLNIFFSDVDKNILTSDQKQSSGVTAPAQPEQPEQAAEPAGQEELPGAEADLPTPV